MLKRLNTSSAFFLFTLIFSLLSFYSFFYRHAFAESMICGIFYSFIFGFRFASSPLTVREVFPIGMLFVFLLILSVSPEKAFTSTLIYTVRLLILGRGLLLVLIRIQNSKKSIPRVDIIWMLGLLLELSISALLLYSTFKSVSLGSLGLAHTFSAKLFFLLTLPFMVYRLKNKNDPHYS